MVKFRNLGIFHEHVTNRILDDLVRAAKPKKINIVGDFHPRGGVKTSVDANWEKQFFYKFFIYKFHSLIILRGKMT